MCNFFVKGVGFLLFQGSIAATDADGPVAACARCDCQLVKHECLQTFVVVNLAIIMRSLHLFPILRLLP